MEAKFCPFCGRAYQPRYPNCYDPADPPDYIKVDLAREPDQRLLGPENSSHFGDPELGPKQLRCPAGHDTLDELIEQETASRGLVVPEDFLQEIQDGSAPTCYDPVPAGVQLAAEVLLEWMKKEKLLFEQECARMETLPDEAFALDPDDRAPLLGEKDPDEQP